MWSTDKMFDEATPILTFDGEYRFLSNFYPAQMDFEGMHFHTSEHAFQAMKTLNMIERMNVAMCTSPGKAKRMGKKVALREDWDAIKIQIMEDVLYEKFIQNEALGWKLLDTGTAQLVEGNDWGDTFWGVDGGVGENWLGKLLMKVRGRLRSMQNEAYRA